LRFFDKSDTRLSFSQSFGLVVSVNLEVTQQMEWLKSKTTMLGIGFVALLGLGGYGVTSMRGALEDRVGSLEAQIHSVQSEDNTKISQLTSDLDTVTSRLERQLRNSNSRTLRSNN